MKRVIKLELSAKRKKALVANDMVPAIILFITGVLTLTDGMNNMLALLNIICGAAIVLAGVREWRSLQVPVHHRIGWYDVICGIVMMIDAVQMYKPWKGFQPAWFYFGLSIFILLKGFGVVKPIGIRRLTITDDEFIIRTGPFTRLRSRWDATERVTMDKGKLIVSTPSGQRTISLRKTANAEEVLAALNETGKISSSN